MTVSSPVRYPHTGRGILFAEKGLEVIIYTHKKHKLSYEERRIAHSFKEWQAYHRHLLTFEDYLQRHNPVLLRWFLTLQYKIATGAYKNKPPLLKNKLAVWQRLTTKGVVQEFHR